MRHENMTPKDHARAIALGALARAYLQIESDFAFDVSNARHRTSAPPRHFRVAIHQAFAKLHNTLGEQWGHDMSSGWLPEDKDDQPVD